MGVEGVLIRIPVGVSLLAIAVCLTHRHRDRRNLRWLLQVCAISDLPRTCRSCRRLRIPVCQIHRIRRRRNLRQLLQDLNRQPYAVICKPDQTLTAFVSRSGKS